MPAVSVLQAVVRPSRSEYSSSLSRCFRQPSIAYARIFRMSGPRVSRSANRPWLLRSVAASCWPALRRRVAPLSVRVSNSSLCPCRYVHTPSQVADYNDARNAVRLLVNALSRDGESSALADIGVQTLGPFEDN